MATNKSKPTKTKKKSYLWILLVIGIIIFLIICIIDHDAPKFWQTSIDNKLEEATKEDKLESQMRSYFFNTLGPDANDYYVDVNGDRSTQIDWYNYASKKTGYICTQIAPYNENASSSDVVECHKK